MKKVIIFLLVIVMVMSLAACGKSEVAEETTTEPASTEPASTTPTSSDAVYTVDVKELDPNVYPSDYPLIASADFEAAFEKLKEANNKAEINDYQDVADFFGVDGAYYENCDMDYSGELYKYYGWYADDGVSVIITFKAEDNNLEYFAWTGNGIM